MRVTTAIEPDRGERRIRMTWPMSVVRRQCVPRIVAMAILVVWCGWWEAWSMAMAGREQWPFGSMFTTIGDTLPLAIGILVVIIVLLLAFAMSKTEKGRAATAKRNAEAAADNQLTEQLMNNPDALDEGEAVPLPKNKAVSPEALQQAKGKLKPLNAPQQPQTSPAPISGQQPGESPDDPNLPLIQEAKKKLKKLPAR